MTTSSSISPIPALTRNGDEQRDDFAGALEQFRAALAICEKLVASNPQDQKYRRELWTSQGKIGYALWLQNDIRWRH